MDRELVDLKQAFMAEAEAAFERMMVQDQEQMLTFTQLEQRAVELSRAFGAGLIQKKLKHRGAAERVCCPRCKGAAQPRGSTGELRRIESLTGAVEFERRKYFCAGCRIHFFPGRHRVEAGH